MKEESFFCSYCNEKLKKQKAKQVWKTEEEKKRVLDSDLILNHGNSELVPLTIVETGCQVKVKRSEYALVCNAHSSPTLSYPQGQQSSHPKSSRYVFPLCVYFR